MSVKDNVIQVMWSPPRDSRGVITYYRVELTNLRLNDAKELTTESTEITIPGVPADTEYQVRVKAFTSVGDGAWSAPSTVKVHGRPPSAPVNFQAKVVDAERSVSLTWEKPNLPYGAPSWQIGIEGYTLTFGKWNKQFNNMTPALGSPRTLRNSDLRLDLPLRDFQKGAEYRFDLIAFNANGNSAAAIAQVVTPEERPTAPPQNISHQYVNRTQIRISWQPPPQDTQNGVIVFYRIRIFRKLADGKYEFMREDGNYTVPAVDIIVNETNSAVLTLAVSVSAANSAGMSEWSDKHVFRVSSMGLLEPIEIERDQTDKSKLRVSWNALNQDQNVEYYKILYIGDSELDDKREEAEWKSQIISDRSANSLILRGIGFIHLFLWVFL